MALTEKQKRFVEEYIIDLNGAQAAIRAGYSPKTACCIASENLAKPAIQAALQQAIQERSKRTEVTADRVLEELAAVAFADGGDENGAHLRYANKLRALELIGKHLGMWDKQEDQTDTSIHVEIDPQLEEWTK